MNERIQELAEQAAGNYTQNFCWEFLPEIDKDIFNKFAELIVRECANQCDLLLNHNMSSEWARGTHDCSKAIKQHFGVE